MGKHDARIVDLHDMVLARPEHAADGVHSNRIMPCRLPEALRDGPQQGAKAPSQVIKEERPWNVRGRHACKRTAKLTEQAVGRSTRCAFCRARPWNTCWRPSCTTA